MAELQRKIQRHLSLTFEILDFALVFFCGIEGFERAQIFAPFCFRIFLS